MGKHLIKWPLSWWGHAPTNWINYLYNKWPHCPKRGKASAGNGQVLPMVGNFIFVRPELLPGFLIKLNIKNQSWALFVKPEPQHSRITAADCSNVKPHYWQYQCCVLLFIVWNTKTNCFQNSCQSFLCCQKLENKCLVWYNQTRHIFLECQSIAVS